MLILMIYPVVKDDMLYSEMSDFLSVKKSIELTIVRLWYASLLTMILYFMNWCSNWIQREVELLRNSNEPNPISHEGHPSRPQDRSKERKLLVRHHHVDAPIWWLHCRCLLRSLFYRSCFIHHLLPGNFYLIFHPFL